MHALDGATYLDVVCLRRVDHGDAVAEVIHKVLRGDFCAYGVGGVRSVAGAELPIEVFGGVGHREGLLGGALRCVHVLSFELVSL